MSNIIGPFGIFAKLIGDASQLVGMLESRVNSTPYDFLINYEQYYEGIQVSASWTATIVLINAISVILIQHHFSHQDTTQQERFESDIDQCRNVGSVNLLVTKCSWLQGRCRSRNRRDRSDTSLKWKRSSDEEAALD